MKNKTTFILFALAGLFAFTACPNGDDATGGGETIINRVQSDYENIEKTFAIVNDNTYIVKSEIDGYEVYYHLDEGVRLEEGTYKIPFDVVQKLNGSNIEGNLIFVPKENTTGVLLSFDDGYQSWIDNAGIFDAYDNVKCTFFISNYWRGDRKAIALFFNQRGHEIGNHTTEHKSLPGLNEEQFEYQTLHTLELMKNDGLHVISFAYPNGNSEPWMHVKLRENYKFMRGYDKYFHVFTVNEWKEGGYFPSKSIDFNKYNSSEAFRKDIKDMFMVIKFMGDGFIAPFTTHTISATDTGWAIRPDDLDYLFKTGTELKVKFYKYNDFE